MSFKAGRLAATALVISLLIPMHIPKSGYAIGRPKIAFSSTRDGDSEIYVMDIDGSNPLRLTVDPARDYDPSWSPDGEKIAFVSDRVNKMEQIYVMDSDGGNLKRLTNGAAHQQPAWSPDGERIAYVRNKGGRQIGVMDADGRNQIQLTEIGKNREPTWSPDGARIAFVSRRNGGQGIYVMDLNGSNQKRLTPNQAFTANPAWSPDGKWIAYEAVDKEHRFQIYVARAVGNPHIERLTREPPHKLQPTWSPDGNTIAYTSWISRFRVNRKTIDLMSAEGEHLKQLSEEHDGDDTYADWYAPIGWSVAPAANFITVWGEIKKRTPALKR
ncbi:MAG: LpqB family beta-propeller domain-containing protein [Candidatus Poribacteria bacterium]|nr:LpqB family beta-propeller domain-containing protein [Candidatus Poribacteria bacterium]MDE0504737.1 LpqB family beta-propeller domain-containing protein [Candidatus Poribacteria bacterium]